MPSASIGAETALFEPIHGSYPQAAGKNIANPLATILSAAMMFEYAFGLIDESNSIRQAVNGSLDQNYTTADLSNTNEFKKTNEVGDWIADYIDRLG